MSEASDKYDALLERCRPLFAKASVQAISLAEKEELQAALDLLKSLEPFLDCRIEVLGPREEARRNAAEVYGVHYRRKAELDQRLYGNPEHN